MIQVEIKEIPKKICQCDPKKKIFKLNQNKKIRSKVNGKTSSSGLFITNKKYLKNTQHKKNINK